MASSGAFIQMVLLLLCVKCDPTGSCISCMKLFSLCLNISALLEAQDIDMHLKPLQHPLEEIENVEFNEVKPLLNHLLHIVCFIWATSKYYSTPARIIVLLQEVCSLLIQQVGHIVFQTFTLQPFLKVEK